MHQHYFPYIYKSSVFICRCFCYLFKIFILLCFCLFVCFAVCFIACLIDCLFSIISFDPHTSALLVSNSDLRKLACKSKTISVPRAFFVSVNHLRCKRISYKETSPTKSSFSYLVWDLGCKKTSAVQKHAVKYLGFSPCEMACTKVYLQYLK